MSFPAPGDSFIDTSLDLNSLVKNPSATFFRVSGDDLAADCIHSGDLLIVDRSLTPTHQYLVVAAVDGALLIRRVHQIRGQSRLKQPTTAAYYSGDFEVWGVVTNAIHTVLERSFKTK